MPPPAVGDRSVGTLRRNPECDGEEFVVGGRFGLGLRRQVLGSHIDQAEVGAPIDDLPVVKAQPVVGVVGLHRCEAVGCEIDDEQSTAGPQRANHFGQRRERIVEEVQHVVQDGDVDRAGFDTDVVRISLPNRTVAVAELVEATAGQVEHLVAEIETETVVDAVGEDLEYSAGAGADVEQLPDFDVLDGCQHGDFDFVVGDVERAHRVPIGGDRLEVGRRGVSAFGSNDCQPPQITGHARVVVIDDRHECIKQRTPRTGPCRAVEGAGSLAVTLQQPASQSSLRWRLTRGWVWPRTRHNSLDRQLATRQHDENP